MKNKRLILRIVGVTLFSAAAALSYALIPRSYIRQPIFVVCLILVLLCATPLVRARINDSDQNRNLVRSAFGVPNAIEKNRALFLFGGILLIVVGFGWLFVGVYLVTIGVAGVDAVFVPFVTMITVGAFLIAFRALLWWFRLMRNGQ